MSNHRVRVLSLGLTALTLCGCSDDGAPIKPRLDVGGTIDVKPIADLAPLADLGALPDLGTKDKCDSEWRTAISPQKKVSTGAVATTDLGGGLNETAIDATAGGMSSAKSNPFVYISLSTGKRVDIDDYAAKTSTGWDIALRRTVIRVNGGDSGAGKAAVAILSGTDLSAVTAVPAASSFATDDFLDDSCLPQLNSISDIKTAVGGSDGMWYQMDTTTMKLSPEPEIYVIKLADGTSHVKLLIKSYYDSSSTGAMYTVQWSKLP